jgi:hypothetical protein
VSDAVIRRMTAAAVLIVALIAAVVSYVHIGHLAVTHGQTTLAAGLLPLPIDGTVAATSLAMLRAARAGAATPWLARSGLVLSVGATLAAGIGYGLPYGAAGALISGWPAVAFIVCAELAIGMVRRMHADAGTVPAPVLPEVAATVLEAAKVAYAASVRGGNPLAERALADRFGITRGQARKVRRALADAEHYRRDSAPAWCPDCAASVDGACRDHLEDLDRAEAYREIATQIVPVLTKSAGRGAVNTTGRPGT